MEEYRQRGGLLVRYSDSVKEEAIALINRGRSKAEVADIIGVSVGTIHTWMMKKGMTRIFKKTGDEEEMNEALDMFRDGKTEYFVSRKLNIWFETIVEWKKEFEEEGYL